MFDRSLGLLVLLLAGGAGGGMAQEPDQPAPGSRVRLTVEAGPRPLVGTLTEWTGTSLILNLSDGPASYPRARIVRLEKQIRPSRRGRGALRGAQVLGGTMLGIVVFYCRGGDFQAGWVVREIAAAAALGAGLGAALAPGARWQDVPLPQGAPHNGPGLKLGLARGGGVAASFSVRF